jgi:hypothetical protein
MSVCVLSAFALAAYSFSVAHSNAQDIRQRTAHDRLVLCHAQNRSNMALRRILVLAQTLVKKAKNIPPKEQLRSVDFYRQALSLVHSLDCDQITRPDQ